MDVAARHGLNGAKYFLMILDVLAEGGFFVGKVFSVFIDLFVDKQLARCKRSLMNLGVHPYSAFLPRGLVYRRTCKSGGTCDRRLAFKTRVTYAIHFCFGVVMHCSVT